MLQAAREVAEVARLRMLLVESVDAARRELAGRRRFFRFGLRLAGGLRRRSGCRRCNRQTCRDDGGEQCFGHEASRFLAAGADPGLQPAEVDNHLKLYSSSIPATASIKR